MTKKPVDEDMRLIERDPRIGPTVKALLSLSAFRHERQRVAAQLRREAAAKEAP